MSLRLAILILFSAVAATASGAAAELLSDPQLPEGTEVMRRVMERAAISTSNRLTGAYTFQRTNITEEYSRKSELVRHEELLLGVTVENGEQEIKLLKLNGRDPTEAEQEHELKRFSRQKEPATSREKPDRSRELGVFITPEVIARYAFTVEERLVMDGRPTLLLTFKPATSSESSSKLVDRVLDRIGGKLWIDEEAAELVKADIQLREKVTLWGGVLGVLEELRLKIQRTREPTDLWHDEVIEARFLGRVVTKRIDVKTWDYSSAPQPIKEVPIVAAE